MRYGHLIMLHTQTRNGYKRRPTVREWLAEFEPYAPGYQPRFGERRVSTQDSQDPKLSLTSKTVEGKKTRATTKKKFVIPKYHSISAIRDFSPIPGGLTLILVRKGRERCLLI
jgi:hypothetical protein